MTLDVKGLKLYFDDIADLLDDYCHVVCTKEGAEQNCFMCPVRRALLDAQSGRLYARGVIEQKQSSYHSKRVRDSLHPKEVINDKQSNSSRLKCY